MLIIVDFLAFVAFIYLLVLTARHSRAGQRLPPGPVGLPLLGNVLQVPLTHLATYFRRLIDQYGGLVSLNLAGFSVILIGDLSLAKELLDKHSIKHSSRPVFYYISHHVDPEERLWGLSREGGAHILARKLTAQVMSDVRAGKTELLQEFEALLNVQLLLDDGGKKWFHHIERLAASTMLTAGFGMHCPTGEEPDLKELLEVLAEVVVLGTPNAAIVNAFPFLDLIPWEMPWQTRAKAYRKRNDALYEKLIEEAIHGKASEMNTWAQVFVNTEKDGDQRHLMSQFAAAAVETTASTLHTYILACIRYPEWTLAAQKEIDEVVGPDRLPSFKDRPHLPYLEAVVRETLRWRPAARFGVPHLSTANDVIEYRGQEYFISEGSLIFPVTWAIEHDPSKYDGHDRFMPERFLDEQGKLKLNYETSAFGFGRRICPGSPFAERSLWIDIAMMLWTFNIRGSKEPDPKTGLPFVYDDSDAAFKGTLTNAPFEFPAVFEPRSPRRAEVARREWAECEKDLNVLLPASRKG